MEVKTLTEWPSPEALESFEAKWIHVDSLSYYKLDNDIFERLKVVVMPDGTCYLRVQNECN